jgi:hypothetical protein
VYRAIATGDLMCCHRCLICIVTLQIILLVLVLADLEGSSADVVLLIAGFTGISVR